MAESPKSPTRLTIVASSEDFEAVAAQISNVPAGTRVRIVFDNKVLDIVAASQRKAVVTSVTEVGPLIEPSTIKKRRGGNPQEAHFNKLARSLHRHYMELKDAFCTRRGQRVGVKPQDILVGNRVKAFSNLRKFINGKPDLEAYYNADPPPEMFNKAGIDWLQGYWSVAVTHREPRDRNAERQALKLRKLNARGGSFTSDAVTGDTDGLAY